MSTCECVGSFLSRDVACQFIKAVQDRLNNDALVYEISEPNAAGEHLVWLSVSQECDYNRYVRLQTNLKDISDWQVAYGLGFIAGRVAALRQPFEQR